MGRGGLILEGAHTNKKIGTKFFHYGVPHIQDNRTLESGVMTDVASFYKQSHLLSSDSMYKVIVSIPAFDLFPHPIITSICTFQLTYFVHI
jgi:hypothetical protein